MSIERPYHHSPAYDALEAIKDMRELEAFLKEHPSEQAMGAFEVSQRFEEWKMKQSSRSVPEDISISGSATPRWIITCGFVGLSLMFAFNPWDHTFITGWPAGFFIGVAFWRK